MNPVSPFRHKPYSVLCELIDISYYDIESVIKLELQHVVRRSAMYHLQMFGLNEKKKSFTHLGHRKLLTKWKNQQ